MSKLIYILALALFGLRGVEYHTSLAPMAEVIMTIVLIIGMYCLIFAWWRLDRFRSK